MIMRNGVVEFNGQPVSVAGLDIIPGNQAEDFRAIRPDWSEISFLEATKGKVRIIASTLSLDTSVCDRETRQFNQDAAALSDDIAIAVVSMDLPFTQERWCGSAGIDKVMVISDHKYAEFGEKYGCLLVEPRILRRAVFIVNKDNIISYAKYMPLLGDEPDYAEVLAEAKSVLIG